MVEYMRGEVYQMGMTTETAFAPVAAKEKILNDPNSEFTRRRFCITATAAAIGTVSSRAFGESTSGSEASTWQMIATVDRARILSAAREYVDRPIQTITSFVSPRSPGGPHDCGVHCNQPQYIALWRALNPDPTDPEIIRQLSYSPALTMVCREAGH
jgi:hypothetical protein